MGSNHSPGPAYHFQRSDGHGAETAVLRKGDVSSGGGAGGEIGDDAESLDYSSHVDSESYMDLASAKGMGIGLACGVGVAGGDTSGSVVTGQIASYPHADRKHADATDTVHEMHLALLYLLSNPEEFEKALAAHPAQGATTLAEWNAEYDTETEAEAESMATAEHNLLYLNSSNAGNRSNTNTGTLINPIMSSSASASTAATTPLPFVVFADDAEVVLPQAHTASQLFGVERLEGIELEAAAGIPALSQLFLRWLALMPGGDHLNIIDPPGLTVMRIAGGRYRVTAAHRVVWTWMNEFYPIGGPAGHQHGISASHDSHRNISNSKSKSNNQQNSSNSSNQNNLGHNYNEAVNSLQVGDLVTMTIVDVFETDSQGKLLSYCPTFDNRAVHKTHQTAEAIRKSSYKLMHFLHQAQKSRLAVLLMSHVKSMAQTVKQRVDEAVSGYQSSSSPGGGGRNRSSLSPEERQSSLELLAATSSTGSGSRTGGRGGDGSASWGQSQSYATDDRTADTRGSGHRTVGGTDMVDHDEDDNDDYDDDMEQHEV